MALDLGAEYLCTAWELHACGNYLSNRGQHSAALDRYVRCLDIQKILSPQNPQIAAMYNNAGTIHKMFNRFTKALELFNTSLALHVASATPCNNALAVIHFNIGTIYWAQRNTQETLHQLGKSIELTRLDPTSPQHLRYLRIRAGILASLPPPLRS